MAVDPIPTNRQDGTTIRAAHVNELAEGVNDLQVQIDDLPPGGYSAYELWLQDGNSGTIEDFFEAQRGPAGPPAVVLGRVPTVGDLPGSPSPGDLWVVDADGHGWMWDGTEWVDVGLMDATGLPELTDGARTTVDDSVPGFLGIDFAGADVQTFTSSGTWTKPAGVTLCIITAIGGGGGGGSGRRGAAGTWRYGGTGGTGGGTIQVIIPAALMGATETVTVGEGGNGGAARTTNDQDGQNGSFGGVTSVGSVVSVLGGLSGNGGTATVGGRREPNASQMVAGYGSHSESLAGGLAAGPPGGHGNTGGGSGGAFISDANLSPLTPSRGGVGAGGDGGLGPWGDNASDGHDGLGGGGGTGGTVGGAGGNGGALGGGGAGGGASLNGTASGAGGRGGDGWCQIVSI